MVELQKHITEIDQEHVQLVSDIYREQYLEYTAELCNSNSGKMLVAVDGEMVLGFIACMIEPKDEEDQLCTRCLVRGLITELIVKKEFRSKGIGQALLQKVEDYLTNQGCEFLSLTVFAPNAGAAEFYQKQGYFARNIEFIKRICDDKL